MNIFTATKRYNSIVDSFTAVLKNPPAPVEEVYRGALSPESQKSISDYVGEGTKQFDPDKMLSAIFYIHRFANRMNPAYIFAKTKLQSLGEYIAVARPQEFVLFAFVVDKLFKEDPDFKSVWPAHSARKQFSVEAPQPPVAHPHPHPQI